MKIHGTGRARHAIAPSSDAAGPTPRFLNIGLAASGRPKASNDRRKVLADVALAAYGPYESTKKFMHCWKIMLKPAPMNYSDLISPNSGETVWYGDILPLHRQLALATVFLDVQSSRT